MSARKTKQAEVLVQSDVVELVEPVVLNEEEVLEMSQESIDKENRVVDLESEIVKLSERLAELKKELRTLTKPESKSGPTKMELATQLWKDQPGLARKEYVEKFMGELGLTLAGARTYIQLIMTKNK